MISRTLQTDNDKTTILIRLMVGIVFLSEGTQKFLFPDDVGAGRFARVGLPSPELLGPFVGAFEIISGTLVLMGLCTRMACVPLVIIMLVALTTTKLDILAKDGFWEMMHASRTDWAMLLGSVFLLVKGSGRWSLDKTISRSWTSL